MVIFWKEIQLLKKTVQEIPYVESPGEDWGEGLNVLKGYAKSEGEDS